MDGVHGLRVSAPSVSRLRGTLESDKDTGPMTLAIQVFFSSLVNGALYVLIGLGVVLCYRSSRVVNLAQGETYTASGILTAKFVALGIPLALSGLFAICAVVLGALLFERFALRSRLHWNPQRLIIITVGVALLVEGMLQILVGSNTYQFASLLGGPSIRVENAAISREGALAVVAAFVITGALVWFFRATLLGQAMTACSENSRASAILGVNVSRMRQLSFGLAAAIGGLAAVLIVPLTGIGFGDGLAITLNGFLAAALANMTHPGRVLWAGMGLGLCEGIVGAYWNPLYEVPFVLGVVLLVGVAYLSRGVRFGGATRA